MPMEFANLRIQQTYTLVTCSQIKFRAMWIPVIPCKLLKHKILSIVGFHFSTAEIKLELMAFKALEVLSFTGLTATFTVWWDYRCIACAVNWTSCSCRIFRDVFDSTPPSHPIYLELMLQQASEATHALVILILADKRLNLPDPLGLFVFVFLDQVN